jgi:hypothetical protein
VNAAKSPIDLFAIRKGNALLLYREFVDKEVAAGETYGLESRFARFLDIHATLWSQLKKARPIKDALARQIERRAARPLGWLDEKRAEAMKEPAADPSWERVVAMLKEEWQAANSRGKREIRSYLVERRRQRCGLAGP